MSKKRNQLNKKNFWFFKNIHEGYVDFIFSDKSLKTTLQDPYFQERNLNYLRYSLPSNFVEISKILRSFCFKNKFFVDLEIIFNLYAKYGLVQKDLKNFKNLTFFLHQSKYLN